MKRRDFLLSTAAAGVATAATSISPVFARPRARLRVAMIGTGMRGQSQLGPLLSRDDIELVAICDTQQVMLDMAQAIIEKAGRRKPKEYGGNGDANAWKNLLARTDLDAVFIVTPWELHAPQSIAAMEAKIAVVLISTQN